MYGWGYWWCNPRSVIELNNACSSKSLPSSDHTKIVFITNASPFLLQGEIYCFFLVNSVYFLPSFFYSFNFFSEFFPKIRHFSCFIFDCCCCYYCASFEIFAKNFDDIVGFFFVASVQFDIWFSWQWIIFSVYSLLLSFAYQNVTSHLQFILRRKKKHKKKCITLFSDLFIWITKNQKKIALFFYHSFF